MQGSVLLLKVRHLLIVVLRSHRTHISVRGSQRVLSIVTHRLSSVACSTSRLLSHVGTRVTRQVVLVKANVRVVEVVHIKLVCRRRHSLTRATSHAKLGEHIGKATTFLHYRRLRRHLSLLLLRVKVNCLMMRHYALVMLSDIDGAFVVLVRLLRDLYRAAIEYVVRIVVIVARSFAKILLR